MKFVLLALAALPLAAGACSVSCDPPYHTTTIDSPSGPTYECVGPTPTPPPAAPSEPTPTPPTYYI